MQFWPEIDPPTCRPSCIVGQDRSSFQRHPRPLLELVRTCGESVVLAGRGAPRQGADTSATLVRTTVEGKGTTRSLSPLPRLMRRSEEHTSELQSQFHLVCRL